MKRPNTGKMLLKREPRSLTFRKEEFTVICFYYECPDTGEQITTSEQDALALTQLYNQYRERHKLPFPDEIISIRKQYGLSAAKMSEVLGFGVNMYRAYESGEVPSESNARLIQLIQDPRRFRELVRISRVYEGQDLKKILEKVDDIVEKQTHKTRFCLTADYLLEKKNPDRYSGYRRPSLRKFTEMVVFFAEELKPWKTALNKFLFYADFSHYRHTGYSISGMRYSAINLGPVPDNFQTLFEQIARADYVDIHTHQIGDNGVGEQFVPNSHHKFNEELFTDEEKGTLQKVANTFRQARNVQEIIDISHEEDGWKKNKDDKKLISYEDAFSLKVNI